MKTIRHSINENPVYAEFTDLNEKFLSDLTGTLKGLISELNSRNSLTDDMFKSLISAIETSNAVFRSFSNHEGLELVLRLKAVSDLYKKNIDNNSSLARIAEHILKKLEKFNTILFHEASSDEIVYPVIPDEAEPDETEIIRDLKYKWLTFERNGSLFICRYDTSEIIDFQGVNVNDTDDKPAVIDYRGMMLPLIDLMRSYDNISVIPRKIIIINNGKFCYAADRIGREIHGSSDYILPSVKPLEISSRFFSGRVRLFGRNYLMLKHD